MPRSSSSPSPAGPTRWSATEALIGRVVQQRLVHEFDAVLGLLWEAGFTYVDRAEDALERCPSARHVKEVQAAEGGLFYALSAAEALLEALQELCSSVPTGSK